MHPTQPEGFFLSLKAIILDGQSRCLMLRRSEQVKNNAGKWEFPGGKMESGELFESALRREVREETGLEIRLVRPFNVALSTLSDRKIVYLFMIAHALCDGVRLSEEHDQYLWAEPHELTRLDIARQFVEIATLLQACDLR